MISIQAADVYTSTTDCSYIRDCQLYQTFLNSLDTVWIQLAESDTYRADVKELCKILTPL